MEKAESRKSATDLGHRAPSPDMAAHYIVGQRDDGVQRKGKQAAKEPKTERQ
jgi:hypothetical protein